MAKKIKKKLNNNITFEITSKIQYETMVALYQSFEKDSVNMDKFLMWCMKKYDSGSSIMMSVLKQI